MWYLLKNFVRKGKKIPDTPNATRELYEMRKSVRSLEEHVENMKRLLQNLEHLVQSFISLPLSPREKYTFQTTLSTRSLRFKNLQNRSTIGSAFNHQVRKRWNSSSSLLWTPKERNMSLKAKLLDHGRMA